MTDHNLSNRMIDTINDLGNALTAAKWPAAKMEPVKIPATKDIYTELISQQSDVYRLEGDYHDAVNELCYKCGAYKREHEGACNGCRWRNPRKGL